ncbi:MAG: hypothetical protein JW841_09735 [Deltaproteobacteria bacterium]|nr:hypothetical protein [Deltaproteobacteria bacterium]
MSVTATIFILCATNILSVANTTPSQPETAIIVANPDATTAEQQYDAMKLQLENQGIAIASFATLLKNLIGTAKIANPDEDALAKKIIKARQLEGYFKTAAAQKLRQEVIDIYEQTPQPTLRLFNRAAEAMQDLASGHLTENETAQAKAVAHDLARRFPDAPVDTLRHPPNVQKLFSQAKVAIRQQSWQKINLTSDIAGDLWIEGRYVGLLNNTLTVSVPKGRYRVWLIRENKPSLPYLIDLDEQELNVNIEYNIDQKIVLAQPLGINCQDCEQELKQLCPRLKVADCVLAKPSLNLDAPPTITSTTTDQVIAPTTSSSFSAWSVAPFGVGQFSQGRPLLGTIMASSQLGLGVWNLITYQKYQDAVEHNKDSESRLRRQANTAALMFYSVIVIGIGEAVIWDLLND